MVFFIFEILVCFYILVSQGIMCDNFLMPSILNVSKRYGLSKTSSGVFLAMGVCLPELIVTMLSFHKHGVKMTEFGLAVVFGGMCWACTMIPAVAYILNFGCRKARPDQSTKPLAVAENRRFKYGFARDMTLALVSMVAYYIALADGTINVNWVVA
jgi:Ca2+/Na+ antiporter